MHNVAAMRHDEKALPVNDEASSLVTSAKAGDSEGFAVLASAYRKTTLNLE